MNQEQMMNDPQLDASICPRCGRPIRRIVIGIRATHFCSFCQRLPAADRPAAAKLLADALARKTQLPLRRGDEGVGSRRKNPGQHKRGQRQGAQTQAPGDGVDIHERKRAGL